MPGTSIYLGVGETLTMEESSTVCFCAPATTPATAIAEHVAGNVEDFAAMMNLRAVELDADAHFANPHGLDASGP